MKKLLITLVILLSPAIASAASYVVPWNGTTTTGVILIMPAPVNGIRSIPFAPYYEATSTTASSFPYASTTAISSSNLVSGNCLQAGTGGLITNIASACGVGGWATTSQNYYESLFSRWNVFGNPTYLAPTTTLGIIVTASSTIGNGLGGGLTIFGGATTTGQTILATSGGNVGIGTTTPFATLSVGVANFASPINPIFLIASSSTGVATTSLFQVSNSSTTISTGLDVANGSITTFAANGSTTIATLSTGNMTFDNDAGNVGWIDLPLLSATNLTQESYTASINGKGMISISALARGGTFSDSERLTFGTSTVARSPSADYNIWKISTSTAISLLNINNLASTTLFTIAGAGNVGIGTSTPVASLSVSTTTQGPGFLQLLNVASTTGATLFNVLGNGNVGVGIGTPTALFTVNGQASSTTFTLSIPPAFAVGDSAVCWRADGSVTVDSGVASCIVSTRKVKHDITSLNMSDSTRRIMGLDPVSFLYNGSNKADLGLVAEDVVKVDSRYAQYNGKKEPAAINWAAITADLVNTVQLQETRIRVLEEQIKKLKK